MIKAIIFDCFGVLTSDLWKEFCAGLPAGVNVDRARELNRQYDAAVISRKEFFDQVHVVTGHRPPEVESLLGETATKNKHLLEYIKKLKKTYKIGLLSNVGSNWITDEFLNEDERLLFDDIIFSHSVLLAKPDPEIFHLAAERIGSAEENIVFIDDSEGHCLSAQSTGMQAIVYKDFVDMKRQLEQLLKS